MTSTLTHQPLSATPNEKNKRAMKGRRRNTTMLSLGALTVTLGALGGWYTYDSLSTRVEYVVAVQDIPYGHVITPDDLTVAEVSATRINALRGQHLDDVVGQTATSHIPVRTLVSQDQISRDTVPAESFVAVGMRLEGYQSPSIAAPGKTARIMEVPKNAGEGQPTSRTLVQKAKIIDVQQDGTVTLVTLQVPAAEAEAVASAAARQETVITVLSERDAR